MEDTAPYRILRETGYMPTIPGMPKGRVALALLRRQLKDIEKVERRQSGDVDSWQVLFAYDVVGFPEAPKRTFKAVAVANFNRFTERWNVAVQPLDAENPATEAFNQWLKTDGAKWEAEAKKLSSAPAPPSMSPPTVENWLQQILRDPATRAAPLVGTGPSPGAQGRFTWHPKEGGLLVTSGLPSTPPGKSYQLWAIRSGVPPVPIPVGTFGVDNKGRGILFRPALPGVENTDAFAVTLETVDGVPSPTGGIYLWSGTR
jgi:anti-sigma-K factor RskA